MWLVYPHNASWFTFVPLFHFVVVVEKKFREHWREIPKIKSWTFFLLLFASESFPQQFTIPQKKCLFSIAQNFFCILFPFIIGDWLCCSIIAIKARAKQTHACVPLPLTYSYISSFHTLVWVSLFSWLSGLFL